MTLPLPSQRTWAVADIVTAAEMNANVRDAVNYLLSPPAAFLYQSTAQSIPNSAFTTVSWNTELLDSYSGHSNTVNPTRYTAQVAGWYYVSGMCTFVTGSGTGRRLAALSVNGSNLAATQAEDQVTGATTTAISFALLQLNVGDYVELSVYQTSGAALNTSAGNACMSILWAHS